VKERQRKLEAAELGARGPVPGLCLVSMVALLASGCNLLKAAAIDRTCEDLPGGCGNGDSESGLPDTVNGPLGVAASQWGSSTLVLVADGGAGQWNARVELATGAPSTTDGPIDFDPLGASFWFFDQATGKLHDASVDGSDQTFTPSARAEGLAFRNQRLYLAAGNAFGWFDEGSGAFDPITVESGLTDLASVFSASETELYLLDRGSSAATPKLLTYDTELFAISTTVKGFLSGPTLGIAQDGFAGPSLEPYLCSSAGAVFSLRSLAAGTVSPAAVPDPESLQALTGQNVDALGDVVDCGWDAWSKRFLLLSKTWGAIYLDSSGQVELRLSPEPGTSFLRGAFYP
jgi:hypothetical protein